jgi:hypothetical protein
MVTTRDYWHARDKAATAPNRLLKTPNATATNSMFSAYVRHGSCLQLLNILCFSTSINDKRPGILCYNNAGFTSKERLIDGQIIQLIRGNRSKHL